MAVNAMPFGPPAFGSHEMTTQLMGISGDTPASETLAKKSMEPRSNHEAPPSMMMPSDSRAIRCLSSA